MFRRTFVPALCSLTLTFLSLTIVAAQIVTPPPQPLTGPGGKQYVHKSVTKNRYGKGGQEYWIYEPDSPRPRTAPVIVFLHGWGGMNPLYYGAWVDHLVKRGNIVVYPRYQANLLTPIKDFLPNTLAAVKDALHRLQTERGHVTPDLSKFATVGHSLGGLFVLYALEHRPNLFQRLIAASPAIGWDHRMLFTAFDHMKQLPASVRLDLSVGGDEGLHDDVTAFAKLLDFGKPANLDYRFTTYPGENHDSARLSSFPAALYWIYRP